MSRGLSKNQRRILGIAYGVNLQTVGGKVKTGSPVEPHWYEKFSTVDYVGIKDLNWNIAAHLIYGLAFNKPGEMITKRNSIICQPAGGVFDMRSKSAMAAKAATVRSIRLLCESGYLILAPNDAPFMRWGYVLTEKGFRVGKDHAETVSDWLIYRAGVCEFHDGSDSPTLRRIPDLLAAGVITFSDIIREAKRHPDRPRHLAARPTCKAFADYPLPTSQHWEDGNSYQGNRSVTAVTVTEGNELPASPIWYAGNTIEDGKVVE